MAVYRVKNFEEIDFVAVNPSEDVFELENGKKYRFSDHICHNCWSGGTVLETVEGETDYFCLLCQNHLTWRKFENDFLPPTGDMLDFLLPVEWGEEELNEWWKEYKIKRLAEEEVKNQILASGKE